MGWSTQTLSELGSAIDNIEAATDKAGLLSALKAYVSLQGFEHVGIGQLLNPATLNGPVSDIGIADFPEEYLQSWFDKNHIMIDPITRYALLARNAFTWEDAYNRADKAGKLVLDRGRDYSLNSGMAIPVAIADMPTGLITLSHSHLDISKNEIAALEIVATHAYTRLLDLVGAEKLPRQWELTARETEVMHYVAAGKTNWEISKILGVSESAIKIHLKNVNHKVQASNRAHAVMLTLRSGHILL